MVSGSKKRVVEIAHIVTWIEAFTIFCMILCHTFPSRWKDLNQYKLLIIQTARRFADKSWLNYDIAFRKEAAATGSTDWSRMNPGLLQAHQLLPPCHKQSLRRLRAILSLASIATPGMMGAVAGPSAAAGFVTPAQRAMGTTLASTALTAQPAEHGPAPLLSQRGVTAIANSAVYSFDSVLVGSHGNFAAFFQRLRSPLVLPSQQQGLPSSGYLLRSPAVCPLRPVSQLTPINVDRFQHELRHHPNPDKVAYVVQGLRDGFHLGFHYSTSLKSAAGNMVSALLNPQVIDNYLHS